MTPYDPIESLREEVDRFFATNTFTPMIVTGFYTQAKVVLAEVDRLRKENKDAWKVAADIARSYTDSMGTEDGMKIAAMIHRDILKEMNRRNKP